MPPQFAAPVIHEKRQLSPRERVLIVLLLVLIILLSSGAVWYFTKDLLVQPTNTISDPRAQADSEIARIFAEAKNKPFVFTAVPNAATSITLPPPPDSNESDLVSYQKFKLAAEIPQSIVENDVAFNMPFMETTFIEYINAIDNPDQIERVIDELHELTLRLNMQFNRPALKDRIEGVTQLAPLDPIVPGSDVRSVYPSVRAVDAYIVAEIMSRLDSDNRTNYNKEAEALIQRGIGYGLYGVSDAEAAKLLVTQYIEAYDKNPANFASSTNTTTNE